MGLLFWWVVCLLFLCVFAGFGVCFAFVFAGFVGFFLVVDMFCCCCWFCRAVCLLVLCVCGCVFVVFVCLLALVCVLPLCLLVLWVSCWLSTCSAAAVARFVGLCVCWFCGFAVL